MRFTITALGSAGGRTVGQVVDDIVRYLEPRLSEQPTPAPAVPSGDGPSSYYADRGTEAGRWSGFGATEAGLAGPVDPTDFARVLAGRDPHTGGRLLTAQGSAGRRPTLGSGNETTRAPDGTALYGIADAAAALDLSQTEIGAMVRFGEHHAAGTLFALLGAPGPQSVGPAGSYLVPWIDKDGSRWVSEAELDRCEQARSVGVSASEVASAGDDLDLLRVTDAARLAGVTTRYLRNLCRQSQHNPEAITAGTLPKRAYVIARRGARGQWLITRRDLVAFLERRNAPAVRVGFDLTLTTEKSLGVLALLGDDHTRGAVLGAIEAGNHVGLAHFEMHAATARSKGKRVLVRGLTIASFRHLTSRALDPFPHHHNVVANTVVDEHGTRRALDARGLYTHAQGASALATIEMRHQLTNKLGVRWRRGRSSGWEIDGINDDVVREFSQRRGEIEDAVAELERQIGRRSTLEEVHTIITATRPPKEHVDTSQLVNGWWARAHRLGFTPHDLERCTGRALPATAAIDRAVLFEQLAHPMDGICANASTFTRSDVLSALCDIGINTNGSEAQPLLISASEAEHVADEFLASALVIQLTTPGAAPGREELFTTTEILGVQQRIADRHREGIRSGAAVVTDEHLAATFEDHPTLSGEQRDLITAFATSGDRLQCGIGRAGAGKTTAMRAAAHAWHAAGFDVVGAAVKGEATRHLAEGAGIPAETIAWYLARQDNPPLHARSVLIIDEASTLSDRDLHAVLCLAERTGATVRLIGDPDQHGAVTAGGMFRHLCETNPERTPELMSTHRVLDRNDRDAARLLRAGQTSEALAMLEGGGHLHVAGDEIELYIGMLTNWWDAHQQGRHHPMVDRRHHTRHQLNRLARQLLRANNELGNTDITASGDRSFAEGDRIVARMVARDLHVPGRPSAYVRNGAVGTITAVTPGSDPRSDRLSVAFDGIGAIEIPRSFFDEHAGPVGRADVGIDHAYAVTSYSVQGATFDISTSRIDEGASRAETYVDITRGRHANHLFITRAADPLDGEHLPKAPDPALHDSIAGRLRRSGPERAAIEFPIADTPTAPARFAAHEPPDTWTTRLPEPTGGPCHLRRQWADALHAVLAYRQHWTPRPGTGTWQWALGALPSDCDARAARQHAVEILDRYAVALAREDLAAQNLTDQWAIEHLATAMSRGSPHQELQRFANVCHAVSEYRKSAGVDDSDRPGNASSLAEFIGPEPVDAVLSAEHRRLTRELQAHSNPQRGTEIALP